MFMSNGLGGGGGSRLVEVDFHVGIGLCDNCFERMGYGCQQSELGSLRLPNFPSAPEWPASLLVACSELTRSAAAEVDPMAATAAERAAAMELGDGAGATFDGEVASWDIFMCCFILSGRENSL